MSKANEKIPVYAPGNDRVVVGSATIADDGYIKFDLHGVEMPAVDSEVTYLSVDLADGISYKTNEVTLTKEPIMDELVYFSFSFHCISMSQADKIREMLMSLPEFHEMGTFNVDYSSPIIPIED